MEMAVFGVRGCAAEQSSGSNSNGNAGFTQLPEALSGQVCVTLLILGSVCAGSLLLGQVVHSGLSCPWRSTETFRCASWLLL